MAYQDLGIRVLVLGVAEARRGIGMVRSDMNQMEKTMRTLSGTSATLGATLTRLGSALAGLGRTLSLTVTLPLLAMGTGLIRSGIQFEDAFMGIGKTVDGVANGIRQVIQLDPALRQMYLKWQANWLAVADASNVALLTPQDRMSLFIQSLSAADRELIYTNELFGQLTQAGKEIREEFRALALEIPIDVNELAQVGELAGALGIQKDQIVEFTRAMAYMGVATDLSATEATDAIAHIANVMGIADSEIADFAWRAGSAIVDLGNKSAATESEITSITLRIAAAGRMAGLTVPEILGFSTALAEMGIKPERGGTAISRVIEEMIMALGDGGEALSGFAKISGMTIAEFQASWERDATGTVIRFLEKAAEAQEKGIPGLKQTLIDMGLSGIRVREVMALLGLNVDSLTDSIEIANQAWIEQIALEEEARKRFQTVAAQIQLMKNAFKDLGITLFDMYKDNLTNFITKLREMLTTFKELDPANQRVIVKLGLVAAAIGPVILVLGLFIQNLGVLITFLFALPRALLLVASAMLTSWLPTLGLVGAALAGLYLLYNSNFLGIKDTVDYLAQQFTWLYDYVIHPYIGLIIDDIKSGDWIGAWENAKNAISWFGDWLNGIALPRIKLWATNAVATIKKEFKTTNWKKVFSDAAEDIGEGISSIISVVANATIPEEDQKKIDKFYDKTIVGNWDKIRQWIDSNDGMFQTGLRGIYGGIKDFVDEILKLDMESFGNAIAKLFGAGWLIGSAIIYAAGTILKAALPLLGTAISSIVNTVSDLITGDFEGVSVNLANLGLGLVDFFGDIMGIKIDPNQRQAIFDTIQITLLGAFNDLKAWFDKYKDPVKKKLDGFYDGIKGFVTNFVKAVDWEQFGSATAGLVGSIAKLLIGIGLLLIVIGSELFEALPGTGEILGSFFNTITAAIQTFNGVITGVSTGDWNDFSDALHNLGESWKGFADSFADNNVLSGILALLVIGKFVGMVRGIGTVLGLTAVASLIRTISAATLAPAISATASALWSLAAPLLAISVLGLPLWGVLLVLGLIVFAILAIHNNWLGLGDKWAEVRTKLGETIEGIKEDLDGLGLHIKDWTIFKMPESLVGLPSGLRINFKAPFVRNNLDIGQGLKDLGQLFVDWVSGIPGWFAGLAGTLWSNFTSPFKWAFQGIIDIANATISVINQVLTLLGLVQNAGTGFTPGVGTSDDWNAWRMRVDDYLTRGYPPDQAMTAAGPEPHHAKGGMTKGWSWVGENGPELMFSGMPSMVLPTGLSHLLASESKLTNAISSMIDRDYRGSGPNYNYYQPNFHGTPSAETRQANTSMYHEYLMASW